MNFLVSGRMLNNPRWFLFLFFGFDRRRLFDMAKENNACNYWGQMGKYPPKHAKNNHKDVWYWKVDPYL